MIVKLKKGYAVVPDNSIVVDRSTSKRPLHVCIVWDNEREVAPIVVLSDMRLDLGTVDKEDAFIDELVAAYPKHLEIRKTENPLPDHRLRVYPYGSFISEKGGYGLFI